MLTLVTRMITYLQLDETQRSSHNSKQPTQHRTSNAKTTVRHDIFLPLSFSFYNMTHIVKAMMLRIRICIYVY